MRCIIIANKDEIFPRALLPVHGRAVIDFLIDEALLQKEISSITIVAHQNSSHLITKHMQNAFPTAQIHVVVSEKLFPVLSNPDDVLILEGNVSTSLRLHDFIRYFRQFKMITKAAYDKINPKSIPFYIVPKKDIDKIDTASQELQTKTFNCGTGFCKLI